MIKIDNLTQSYTIWENNNNKYDKTVLDGVSLDIPSGQFWAVLGPNGCGKSTLAKHLNSLLLPKEGTVWIDGKNTSVKENLMVIRNQVGMVFQNPDNQIIGSSVEEDVAFGPENKDMPSKEIQSIVSRCLQAVGLEKKRCSSPNRLSGGEKQRVAIAGVLASSPDCIVLDEPTAMLDPSARKEVLRIIHELNRDAGITIILITHHTDEVMQADQIVVMEKGKILKIAKPSEIFSDERLLRRVKMDLPQIVELGNRLKNRGLAITTPALSEDLLYQEIKDILDAKKEGKKSC